MAMNKEYFWAGQLSKKKPSITWNPTIGDEDDDDSFDESSVQHFLFLKQAVLGPKAEGDERSVVQVTSEDIDGETIKHPLFSLRLGLNECTTLDVGFQPPVTFTLVAGPGPVYMSGQHALELQDDDKLDDFADEEDEEEEDEEDEEEAVKIFGQLDEGKTKKRKRPMDTPSDINKKKQPKLDQSASSGKTSEDEDDDDDEDDEDFDPKAVKNESKTSEENDDDDDEDDDDDFEDMEDDDDEDDSEEDDEDDDEEDEEEADEEETAKVNAKKNSKPQKKNTKLNGKASKGEVKTPGGGDAKAKGTQKKKGGKPQTVQEIKDDIAKSPGKPKKEVKFFNYVKNTYRVTDQQKLQELWNWHKNTNL